MSIHIHATILTSHGVAANNRGLNEGNITTLQKVVWNIGQMHTTVSAESIRFALRQRLQEAKEMLNRTYDEAERINTWIDPDFTDWKKSGQKYLDDDLLGFMSAKAASNEASDDSESGGKGNKGTIIRRSPLEISRAVSLLPWLGDNTFNAASPGATPSAAKKGINPVPYGTEMHATRYQYSLTLTPEYLRQPKRAEVALKTICSLGSVAGNNARFLFDFTPESIVIRITEDPAPRIMYCFDVIEDGSIQLDQLIQKVKQGDIKKDELFVGGLILNNLSSEDSQVLGVSDSADTGVMTACTSALKRAKLT